jgi:hypothetical protein
VPRRALLPGPVVLPRDRLFELVLNPHLPVPESERGWVSAYVPAMRAFALVLLAACAPEPAMPAVHFVVDGSPAYLDAARAWEALGFTFETTDQPECLRHWYLTPDRDCQITITVVRYPRLREEYGTNAISRITDRTFAIDTRELDESELRRAAVHETGHILLDTTEHTLGGIMGGASLSITDADRVLACRTIGICLDI